MRFKQYKKFGGSAVDRIGVHVDQYLAMGAQKITIEPITEAERNAAGDDVNFWQWRLTVEREGDPGE